MIFKSSLMLLLSFLLFACLLSMSNFYLPFPTRAEAIASAMMRQSLGVLLRPVSFL